MSNTPNYNHQFTVTTLVRLIGEHVSQKELGIVLVAPFDIQLPDTVKPVQPDIVFIPADKQPKDGDQLFEGVPDLIIEVISPESIRTDYVVKFSLYERAGVREYWMVEPRTRFVEIYTLSTDSSEYVLEGQFSPSEQLYSFVLSDLALTVDSLFLAVEKEPAQTTELATKVEVLEKERESLETEIELLTNEFELIKDMMLASRVYKELNKCQQDRSPIENFRQRLKPLLNPQQKDNMEEMLATCCVGYFDNVWINYEIQLSEKIVLDILAEGADEKSRWALVFAIKNRTEKNLPSMREAEKFVANVSIVKQYLAQKEKPIRFVFPVYLSAEGFDSPVEEWLHGQGVFTTDIAHWEQ
jgi:Uma2 family endonuclease